MNNQELINQLNNYGSSKEPFFFMISYDLKNYFLKPLKDLPQDIKYEISPKEKKSSIKNEALIKYPMSFEEYKTKFEYVQEQIASGNSYLLNLTAKTKIECDLSLDEIYEKSESKFKLKFKDEFVCFSPERFIKIKKDKIYTYPMKGTIDASIDNASAKILGDMKEMAEHTMVVDLLRNDLGIVSTKVRVDRFRYIDEIQAGDKKLLQVSSKISGELQSNWNEKLGDILLSLLPAGSITGTPKRKTVEIIKEIEGYERDYYTGIFGVFDGKSLDSSVMIRFIQKDKDENLYYKSGGGITCDSDAKLEYQEILDKIYLPF
ncbi:aminodeoxychorismate synthase component I [Arcobacter sp.]|uniref:aminodeoxychorismate synthase component I n=1 Tax=unclassified Arcobacter TaxID=2593671 RepID=UPI003B0017D6